MRLLNLMSELQFYRQFFAVQPAARSNEANNYLRKLTVSTWKWMVGIPGSFWEGLLARAMLFLGSVIAFAMISMVYDCFLHPSLLVDESLFLCCPLWTTARNTCCQICPMNELNEQPFFCAKTKNHSPLPSRPTMRTSVGNSRATVVSDWRSTLGESHMASHVSGFCHTQTFFHEICDFKWMVIVSQHLFCFSFITPWTFWGRSVGSTSFWMMCTFTYCTIVHIILCSYCTLYFFYILYFDLHFMQHWYITCRLDILKFHPDGQIWESPPKVGYVRKINPSNVTSQQKSCVEYMLRVYIFNMIVTLSV